MNARSFVLIILVCSALAVPAQSQRPAEAPTQRPDPTAQLEREITKLEQMVAQLQSQHAQQTQILQTLSSQVSVVDRRLFITCLWVQDDRLRGLPNARTELLSMGPLCSPANSPRQDLVNLYQPR